MISFAEYQLFIDEMREKQEYLQPDHWTAYQFPPGHVELAVTSVRAIDAKKFCQWLSEKEGVLYRLPYWEEVQTYFPTETTIYYIISQI